MATCTMEQTSNVIDLLGSEADALLGHKCKTIGKSALQLPGPDFVDRVVAQSDRPIPVLRALQSIFNHGRLAGTGYVSILPVDQGIEHTAGASFAPEPIGGQKICPQNPLPGQAQS